MGLACHVARADACDIAVSSAVNEDRSGEWDTHILPADGTTIWAGMSDFVLLTANGAHRLVLEYVGEPPFGDSYHRLTIDGLNFPGLVWGGLFATTNDGRYLAASWMAHLYQRKIIIVDLETAMFRKFDVLAGTFAFADRQLVCTDVEGQVFHIDVDTVE